MISWPLARGAVLLAFWYGSTMDFEEQAWYPAAPAPAGPVLLELFTSQGCSSCPPADRVLSRLGLDDATREKVVPLAFHVDYWDSLGWTDPFGKPQWSARQEAYRRALGLQSAYTPQLVVNGRAQLNGSREQQAREEIAADLARPVLVRLRLEARIGGSPSRPELSVALAADVAADVPARKLDAYVALFENGLETAVGRGENGGHTLRSDFVVRRLERAFSLEGKAGAHGERTLALGLDREWKTDNLGVAGFVQEPGTLRVAAAAARKLR
jgi:hypothetical protein